MVRRFERDLRRGVHQRPGLAHDLAVHPDEAREHEGFGSLPRRSQPFVEHELIEADIVAWLYVRRVSDPLQALKTPLLSSVAQQSTPIRAATSPPCPARPSSSRARCSVAIARDWSTPYNAG
jgi:hypothetical protein